MNTIDVDENGNCTVFGTDAHELWNYGRGADFPRKPYATNRFFVFERNELPYGTRWIMRAAQSSREGALRYMDGHGRVLVSIANPNAGEAQAYPAGRWSK